MTVTCRVARRRLRRRLQYPVERFALDEKANKDLAALCRLLEVDADQVTIRFGREAVEEATKLGAAHASASGFQSLIVGDDVAAQLAGDYLKAQLKAQRAQRRREREPSAAPQPHDRAEPDEPKRGGGRGASVAPTRGAQAGPGAGGGVQR